MLIEWDSFKKWQSLTKISIPSSVKEIDSYAFYECPSLVEAELPSKQSKIGSKFHLLKKSLKLNLTHFANALLWMELKFMEI